MIGMLLGSAVNYLFGTVWLCVQLHLSFAEGLMIGVVPYLFFDIAKILIALFGGLKLCFYKPFTFVKVLGSASLEFFHGSSLNR